MIWCEGSFEDRNILSKCDYREISMSQKDHHNPRRINELIGVILGFMTFELLLMPIIGLFVSYGYMKLLAVL